MKKIVSLALLAVLIGLTACTPKTPVVTEPPVVTDNTTGTNTTNSSTQATPLQSGEGFAVYLTVYDIPPDKLAPDNRIDIVNEPVFSATDIISYAAATHEITLTQTAMEKIVNLIVPLSGRSFAVCVDKKPVYTGAFWTPISSLSFDGVVILKPLSHREDNAVKLDLGYPSAPFFKGEDPRSNTEVTKSLEKAGKLK